MLERPSEGQLVQPCVQSRPKPALDQLLKALPVEFSLQGWRFHSLPKKPAPVFNHPHHEKYFPVI